MIHDAHLSVCFFVHFLHQQITDSVFIVRMIVLILAGLGGLAGSALLFYLDVVQNRRPITGQAAVLLASPSITNSQAQPVQNNVENLH